MRPVEDRHILVRELLLPPQALDLVGDEGRLAPLVVSPEKLDHFAVGVVGKEGFAPGRSRLFSNDGVGRLEDPLWSSGSFAPA